MTETELLRLPEIPEGPPAEQLKAVKRYLCRLAEQLEYILTNERRERLRDRLAASPKVAEGILAASARRFGSQYVELQDYERDRAGRETLIWENRDRLNDLDRQEPERPEPVTDREKETPTLLKDHGGRWQV